MVVIKLGGSLHDSPHLQTWLDVLANQTKHTIVIVPGGGPFAEQVRSIDQQLSLPDHTAHAMAVLGMQQFAYMLQGLQNKLSFVSQIEDLLAKPFMPGSSIWLPYDEVLNTNELSRHWQTTSDSIALWLAIRLQANQLILIKSAPLLNKSTHELIESDIVDDHFQTMFEKYAGTVEFMHAAEALQVMDRITA